MPSRTRIRPELFEISGATWNSINSAVWVDTQQDAARVAEVLRQNGYSYSHGQHWGDPGYDVTAFRFEDRDGRNHGRAGGANEHITLFLRILDDRRVDYEVAFRFDEDDEWARVGPVVGYHGQPTFIMDYEADSLVIRLRDSRPDTQFRVRPALPSS